MLEKGVFSLRALAVATLLIGATLSSAQAGLIDVQLRCITSTVPNGDVLEVELWMVSQQQPSQDWVASDILMRWDPAFSFVGFEDEPVASLGLSGPISLVPAENGKGWSASAAFFESVIIAPGVGTHVTTLKLRGTTEFDDARIWLLASDDVGDSSIFDPNYNDVLGNLGPCCTVDVIVPEPLTLSFMLIGACLALRRRR